MWRNISKLCLEALGQLDLNYFCIFITKKRKNILKNQTPTTFWILHIYKTKCLFEKKSRDKLNIFLYFLKVILLLSKYTPLVILPATCKS
jgi:hypothetical protein